MVSNQTYIILLLLLNIMIMSCTTTSNHNMHHSSINTIYKSAQKKLSNQNYTGAIQDFLNLQNLYLLEPCAQQIHLNLIYAYYKSNDLISANNFIQRFLQLYPNHKHLDYVLYMHGLINMSLDKKSINFFTKYLHINWFDRTPIYANTAFHSFLKLIQNYPNSQYFIDAHKRLIFLKNRLAAHELSIIKFYDKKNAYISVIMRSEKILYYFPDTQSAYQALYYMKRSYQNMNLLDQSNKIEKIITENVTTY